MDFSKSNRHNKRKTIFCEKQERASSLRVNAKQVRKPEMWQLPKVHVFHKLAAPQKYNALVERLTCGKGLTKSNSL